jgi:glucose-1-phosphate adenylyltransferase
MAVDSMVSGGCIISGSTVRHSLLFSEVRVNSYSLVENSVLLPGAELGRRSRIRNAVIDEGVYIPPDTEIGFDLERDARRFFVTDGGITLVVSDMLNEE